MFSQEVIFEIAYLGIVFFVALILSLCFVWISRRLAIYMGVMDNPNKRKIHKTPIPCLGGFAMAVAMGISLVLSWSNPFEQMKAFLLGGAVITFVGLMDDKFHLSPMLKLFGQILALIVFINADGPVLYSFGNLLGFGEITTGSFAPFITLLCMLGVINAMNLSDGLDGLAGGIGVIASLFFIIFAYQHQAWDWVVITLILMGILIGFLRFNQYSAMLFMGDTGSLLIGFSLAAISVGLAQGGGQAAPVRPITLAVVLGVPIIDTLWVMTRRLIIKRHPFRPDKSHLHHRLLRLGIGHSQVVTIIYGMMLFFGFFAWFGSKWPEWVQFLASILLFTIIYIGLYLAEKYKSSLWIKTASYFSLPRIKIDDVGSISLLLKYTPSIILILLFIPSLLIIPLPWMFGFLAASAGLFLFLLYPWRTGKRSLLIAHGVMYSACFFLLIIYILAPNRPQNLLIILSSISFVALIWVVLKVISSHKDPILYPTGFEAIIISFSWVIPFVALPMLGVGSNINYLIIVACILSLPLLYLIKLTVRRDRRRNNWVALCFMAVFVLLSCAAFFNWGAVST